MKTSHKTEKGFTLIELLVVIAIVGLLSSIVLAALGSARANGRTAQREETLLTLRNALELYYTKNGHYPITPGGVAYESDYDIADFLGYGSVSLDTNSGNWIPGLVADGDIGALPHDPNPGVIVSGCDSGASNWFGYPESAEYIYESDNGSGYDLVSVCGAENSIAPSNILYDTYLANQGAANNRVLKICVNGNSVPNECNGATGGWF